MSKLIKYAEDTSHAFLGESSSGPANPANSDLQRVLAHGLGYAFSPLRYGLELASDGVTALLPKQRGRGSPRLAALPQKVAEMPPNQQKKKQQKKKKPKGRFKKKGIKKLRPTFSISRLRRKQGVRRPTFSNFTKQYNREFQAPTSIGFRRNWSNTLTFSAGQRPGCFVLRGKQLLGDMFVGTQVDTSTSVYLAVSNTGKKITQFYVMPQNNLYFGHGPCNGFTEFMERYEISTRLHFLTSSPTQTPGALKLAYFGDPVMFYANTAKTGTIFNEDDPKLPAKVDTPISADLADCQNIADGSVWKDLVTPWSRKQPKDPFKYVPGFTYSEYVDPSVTEAEDIRANAQGVWVFSGAGMQPGGANTTVSIGELWIEYDLQLCDVMTVQTFTQLPLPDGTKMTVRVRPTSTRAKRQAKENKEAEKMLTRIELLEQKLKLTQVPDSDWTKLRSKSVSRKHEKKGED